MCCVDVCMYVCMCCVESESVPATIGLATLKEGGAPPPILGIYVWCVVRECG